MTSTKIIFLDFDGVLNSRAYLARVMAERRRQGLPCFGTDDDGYMISRAMVDRLNRIISATGAKVVISSTWRALHSMDELLRFLGAAGFEGEVVGKTPTVSPTGTRGSEIQEWINAQYVGGVHGVPDTIVILDDASDMEHLSDRLVQTDFEAGLEDQHVERAIVMLGRAVTA